MTCPSCKREFEPKRPWQRFDQPTCRYRARWEKFRVVPAAELHQLADLARKLEESETAKHRA